MLLTGTGPPVYGWLVVGADARIVAADAAACLLLGARAPGDLQGHAWTALVSAADGAMLADAAAAVRAGHSWRGALRLIGVASPQPVEIEIVPVDAAGGVALIHLRGSAPLAALSRDRPRPDGDTILAAQIAALEAITALPEPHAVARAVLQALTGTVAFDWGAVLRFVDDPRLGAPGAEVVAVYPAPMAGIDRGVAWSPLDPAQAGVLASGEPELTAQLAGDPAARSPLRRMAAFGMTSRVHLPLYDGPRVAGCLVLYASSTPLGLADGIAIERITRLLGAHLVDRAAGGVPQEAPAAEPLATPLPTPAATANGAAPGAQTTEQQVAEANVAAASGASAHLSALSEVISGVAHELNNPLTAILGYAQIFHALDGAEREHAVNTIEQEAQRAARIVRNLLSFARQEPPHTSRVDIEEIVRRVVEVMRYSLEVDNVRAELRFAGVPEVEADRAQLEQVFLNLVNNAQQALQPGGGEIVVTTSSAGGRVRVSVADNGPGVPEEMRDRVFEPFFTTRDVGLGPGMGLSTVYGIVTQHGGRVWVEASPSGGANFVVELPVRLAAPSTGGAVAAPAASGAAFERLLVVDDELPIRALTSEILNHAGYQVTTAASGEEALRRLEAVAYDLVIVDMRMPGMDGAALYEHICDRWPHMQGRVVFLTGDIEGARTSRRLARGDVRFLEKPFDTSALLGAIRAVLDAQA